MADNLLSNVVGTPSDPTAGLAAVEEYLVTSLLEEREYNTPLAQTKYASNRNLPKKMGQYAKFTRRQKIRSPEVAKEATDPLSAAPVSYEQLRVPIEWINDYAAVSLFLEDTSWLDVAEDFKELTVEAIRRYMNRAVQAAFLNGRYKPGYRNSSGVTVGDATYPHFWTEAETTVTLYGQSFAFKKAPRYYGGNKENLDAVNPATDYATMDLFRRIRVGLRNSGTPTINGKYVAVISEAVAADLKRDDKYFEAAIRNSKASDMIFEGQLSDYDGWHWVLEDEPWTFNAAGNGSDETALLTSGNTHVCQVFGQDAFGHLRLGGKQTVRPKFKVQDISVTGNRTTVGYVFPFQAMILNPDWCANVIVPVRDNIVNNAP